MLPGRASGADGSQIARRRALVEKLIGNAGALQPFELKQIKKDHGLDLEHFHVGIIISDLNTKLSSDLGELQRNLQDAIIGDTPLVSFLHSAFDMGLGQYTARPY